jgi:hypothetical protein
MRLTVNGGFIQTLASYNVPTYIGGLGSANYDNAQAFDVVGRYAYIVSDLSTDRLNIVDITNPAAPVEVGSYNNSTNINNAKEVEVEGRYAFISNDNNNGNPDVTIMDISNPNSPTLVPTIDGTALNGARSLEVVGRYLYVIGYDADTFLIYDVGTPSVPRLVGSVTDATNLDTPKYIQIQGRYAYITSYIGDRLTIVDISNPAAPTVAGSVTNGTTLNGANTLRIIGRYAYVAAQVYGGVTVVDVEDPSTPVVAGSVTHANLESINDLDIIGQYAVTINDDAGAAGNRNRMNIVDVSVPASPSLLGTLQDNTNLDSGQMIKIFGRYIFTTADDNGGTGTNGTFSIWEIAGNRLIGTDVATLRATTGMIDSTLTVGGQVNFASGLNVGGSVQINSGLGVSGDTTFLTSTNSATAF